MVLANLIPFHGEDRGSIPRGDAIGFKYLASLIAPG